MSWQPSSAWEPEAAPLNVTYLSWTRGELRLVAGLAFDDAGLPVQLRIGAATTALEPRDILERLGVIVPLDKWPALVVALISARDGS